MVKNNNKTLCMFILYNKARRTYIYVAGRSTGPYCLKVLEGTFFLKSIPRAMSASFSYINVCILFMYIWRINSF